MFKKYPAFKRFSKYNKWNDLYDRESIEFPISFLITLIFIFAFYFLDVYSNFEYFQNDFKGLFLNIFAALIGLLGILLAGMSFISSIINDDKRTIIAKISKEKEALESILVSFEFLAFIIGIQIFSFILIFICISSNKLLVNLYLFYIISALVIYTLSFTIFYVISLIGNCIKLHSIVNKIDVLNFNIQDSISKANEIRIDFIFKHIIDTNNPKVFLENLIKYVDNSNISSEEKISIKKYFKGYYKYKE